MNHDSTNPRPTTEPLSVEDPLLIRTLRDHGTERVLFGRFRLIRELGTGGMAVVWLAVDERLGLKVALKFLPGMVAGAPEALVDLRHEIMRGLRLTHTGIVRLYDMHEDPEARLAAISMEYVDGPTLADEKARQPGRCYDVGEPLSTWTRELCDVLTYVHEKARVVHRDLKPRNLMLNTEGALKVADFGIAAKLCDSTSRVTKRRGTSGTPVYMSPQQALGEQPTAADDVYALGATLYEMLSSKPPFFRGNMSVVLHQVATATPPSIQRRREEFDLGDRPGIPEEWEETIAACLAKEPEDRPASAREVSMRLGLVSGTGTVGSLSSIEPGEAERSSERGGGTWESRDTVSLAIAARKRLEAALASSASGGKALSSNPARRSSALRKGAGVLLFFLFVAGIALLAMREELPANTRKPTATASSLKPAAAPTPAAAARPVESKPVVESQPPPNLAVPEVVSSVPLPPPAATPAPVLLPVAPALSETKATATPERPAATPTPKPAVTTAAQPTPRPGTKSAQTKTAQTSAPNKTAAKSAKPTPASEPKRAPAPVARQQPTPPIPRATLASDDRDDDYYKRRDEERRRESDKRRAEDQQRDDARRRDREEQYRKEDEEDRLAKDAAAKKPRSPRTHVGIYLDGAGHLQRVDLKPNP